MARDYITLLRTVHNLKLVNYFWKFPFNSFGLPLTAFQVMESETADNAGDYCNIMCRVVDSKNVAGFCDSPKKQLNPIQ